MTRSVIPVLGRPSRSRGGAIVLLLLLTCAVCVLAACAGKKVKTKAAPDLGGYRVRSVVVMPFATLETPQVERTEAREPPPPEGVVKSDITMIPAGPSKRRDERTAAVPVNVGMKVARIFSFKLRSREGLHVVSPLLAERELKQLGPEAADLKPEELSRRVAVRLKADAAVVGLVRVYRERVGSKYGAEPAAVGFEVKLVSAADGRALWAGDYYEQQRPATEDFSGVMDRGIGFVKAEDLATYGAERMISKFPYGAPPPWQESR